jgi:hypothetical protein
MLRVRFSTLRHSIEYNVLSALSRHAMIARSCAQKRNCGSPPASTSKPEQRYARIRNIAGWKSVYFVGNSQSSNYFCPVSRRPAYSTLLSVRCAMVRYQQGHPGQPMCCPCSKCRHLALIRPMHLPHRILPLCGLDTSHDEQIQRLATRYESAELTILSNGQHSCDLPKRTLGLLTPTTFGTPTTSKHALLACARQASVPRTWDATFFSLIPDTLARLNLARSMQRRTGLFADPSPTRRASLLPWMYTLPTIFLQTSVGDH